MKCVFFVSASDALRAGAGDDLPHNIYISGCGTQTDHHSFKSFLWILPTLLGITGQPFLCHHDFK
jgi:hypothetical protein